MLIIIVRHMPEKGFASTSPLVLRMFLYTIRLVHLGPPICGGQMYPYSLVLDKYSVTFFADEIFSM